MRYPYVSLAIDKCRLLICCYNPFYEFALDYEKKLLLLFDSIIYIIYCIIYTGYYILYVYSILYTICI
jgi:hypothetical protein